MMSLVAAGSDQEVWNRHCSWAVLYNSSPGATIGNTSSICAGSYKFLDTDRPHRSRMHKSCRSFGLSLRMALDWMVLEWLPVAVGPMHTALPRGRTLGIEYKTSLAQEYVGLGLSWPVDSD